MVLELQSARWTGRCGVRVSYTRRLRGCRLAKACWLCGAVFQREACLQGVKRKTGCAAPACAIWQRRRTCCILHDDTRVHLGL
eukprot:357485-Chlamydomonas_euryale.AAC.4